MAASVDTLQKLHQLVAQSYTDRIQKDLEEEFPTDAATLAGAAKFLKDNNITADPADTDDLAKMREALITQKARRTEQRGNVLKLVREDD